MTQQQTMTKTLHPLDVPARLDEFRDMKDGWLEGEGIAPSHEGLDWLTDMFVRHFPDNTSLPHTYPTFEGDIRMEWSHGKNAMILEINLNTHKAEWIWFDRDSDDDHERVLDMGNHQHWKWLASEIQEKTTAE